MNVTAQDEIYMYVEAVRQALAGVDEVIRQELLEDLPEHLAEVQAEGIGTLVERLGTPEAYASELLASAGLVGGFPDPPPQRFVQIIEARERALRVLGRADVRVGPVIGYDKASDFLVLLRPAWWVLRGYLAAMAIAWVFTGDRSGFGLLPRVGGSAVLALLLVTGGVVLSILLGRRQPTLTRGPRYALRSATVLLALFALAGAVTIDSDSQYPGYTRVVNYDNNPYSNVNDVFVYDRQGRLVEGARIFDQNGDPIQLGNTWCTDANGESSRSRSMGYPYCPAEAPFGTFPSGGPTSTGPGPEPTDTIAPSTTAAPTPSHSAAPAATHATPTTPATSAPTASR